MHVENTLTDQFEATRPHLRSVAFHLLGSVDDADDAVQAAWLKASRADWHTVQNPAGWLTTITIRQSMDQLRARTRRGEVALDDQSAPDRRSWAPAADEEVLRADSVSRALLIVLGRLSAAQRAAFVLHDVFAMPFDEIAGLLDRSPAATKKLASRARQRLHEARNVAPETTTTHMRIVEALLVAIRNGDIPAVLDLLDTDAVRRVDRILVPKAVPPEKRGSVEVANESRLFTLRARSGAVVLVDGDPGIAIAPHGQLRAVLRIEIGDDQLIREIDIIGDQDRLDRLTLTIPG